MATTKFYYFSCHQRKKSKHNKCNNINLFKDIDFVTLHFFKAMLGLPLFAELLDMVIKGCFISWHYNDIYDSILPNQSTSYAVPASYKTFPPEESPEGQSLCQWS